MKKIISLALMSGALMANTFQFQVLNEDNKSILEKRFLNIHKVKFPIVFSETEEKSYISSILYSPDEKTITMSTFKTGISIESVYLNNGDIKYKISNSELNEIRTDKNTGSEMPIISVYTEEMLLPEGKEVKILLGHKTFILKNISTY